MIEVRLAGRPGTTIPQVLVLPVAPARGSADEGDARDGGDAAAAGAALVPSSMPIEDDLRAEIEAYLVESKHSGGRGAVASLPRPLRQPRRVLLVGVGAASDEADWRAAGAAIARAASAETALTIAMPLPMPAPDASSGDGETPVAQDPADADAEADRVRGVAEGLWLASYKFRVTQERHVAADDSGVPDRIAAGAVTNGDGTLGQVTLLVHDPDAMSASLTDAHTTATATLFARDLTNMPSEEKTPAWFAGQISAIAAAKQGLTVTVRSAEDLVTGGFGGIVAVGGGSARGPRLVELAWQPEQATAHVVLVGKGITFDTGGISIKPRDGMLLMRKDMGGAAAIMAAALAAAEMELPVRVTALAPLAENSVSGSSMRPGDVIRHYGGMTSEVLDTDAEGRLVLADALAYAVAELQPDYLVDLATLTGANAVALGKRTGALYSENDALADALSRAASQAGEQVWRMPLHDEYAPNIRSEVADVANTSYTGGGSIMAALFLREFTGAARPVWAHIDMSAPSWAGAADAELAKGATGWGVRTLVRWLSTF